MHIAVEIPEAELVRVEELATARRVTRGQIILEAIEAYLLQKANDHNDAGFGIWRDLGEDGLDYQTRMRNEW